MKRILFALVFVFGICFADTCPVCPTQTYYYEFINLTYGETWSAQWIYPGLFVTAPPIPTYNLNWNLSYGQSENLTEANITCTAPNFSAINKNDTIYPNQTVSYARWNYSITAMPCQVPLVTNCTNSTIVSNATCPTGVSNLNENLGYIILFALLLTAIIEIIFYFVRAHKKAKSKE